MNTCTNCGNEITGQGFQYGHGEVCKPCEDSFRDEQAARFDEFDVHLFEVELEAEEHEEHEQDETFDEEPILDDEEAFASAGHGLDESYMGGLDSDLLGEE